MSEVDQPPWVMDFDNIVTAITLELGIELGVVAKTPVTALADRALVVGALYKYYNPLSQWGFEEIATVMAEQVLNQMSKDRS